ncbi:anthranilate phosphoribosyltransferase [Sphingomicrobium astaxanthinifaciens]|uniref:anthranilate phosphoribosyltransferase n=1 Tax=Sphingomicrobium astaxanthinifaciens TaxID=1227949 RepID=UPI001FCC60BD|nr:anthranilate phosphoribosyltransferase [Sphingomicrobium astaxanthinifaciens]MCJ7421201.1 anthranilate phosphoribosyltransferase [Sphingomicrobium astaxanthinifaciens]
MLDKASLPADQGPVPNPLPKLLSGEDLPSDDARHLFERLVLGRLSEAEIASVLVALRMKGETAEEMIGAARALGEAAEAFPSPDGLFADCCGTGGDSAGIINVSTAAGFVAAACRLPIAKHGNRSVSSKCGSADVLEALGARIDIPADAARALLDATGFTFLYAPAYHPGMRHAGPVRRQLGVRTVMNLLGPCINPARPRVQLLGVADPTLMRRIARTLQAMGVEKALVVHGAGLDELALHADSRALRLDHDTISEEIIAPEAVGLDPAPLKAVAGGEAAENAVRLRRLLEGEGSKPERDMVALNAGALLHLAGLHATLAEGVAAAGAAIDTGAAGERLAAYVEASNG